MKTKSQHNKINEQQLKYTKTIRQEYTTLTRLRIGYTALTDKHIFEKPIPYSAIYYVLCHTNSFFLNLE